MDKKLATKAAQKIRLCLERRIAEILECQPSDLPYMKLGVLVHFAFLLKGNSHEMGGFGATMAAMTQVLNPELLWDAEPEKTEEAATKVEVIN